MDNSLSQLEKIDVIRERTDLDFAEAKELLEEANWDILEALAIHEQEEKATVNEWEVKGQEVVNKVKQLVKEGNVTKIRVKSNGNTILEIPVTVGVVGAVLAPKLAVLGAATCMLTKCTIEFERKGGKSTEAWEEDIDSLGQD